MKTVNEWLKHTYVYIRSEGRGREEGRSQRRQTGRMSEEEQTQVHKLGESEPLLTEWSRIKGPAQ